MFLSRASELTFFTFFYMGCSYDKKGIWPEIKPASIILKEYYT